LGALELARERWQARIQFRTRENGNKRIIPVLRRAGQGEPNLAVDPIDDPFGSDHHRKGSGAARDGILELLLPIARDKIVLVEPNREVGCFGFGRRQQAAFQLARRLGIRARVAQK